MEVEGELQLRIGPDKSSVYLFVVINVSCYEWFP